MRPVDVNVRIPSVDELKAHVRKHQVVYSFGAGVVVAGLSFALLSSSEPDAIQIINLFGQEFTGGEVANKTSAIIERSRPN